MNIKEHDYLTFRDGIDLTIERLDGRKYSLKEHGIGVRDFVPASPYYDTEYETLEGQDGVIDTGTKLGFRKISTELYFVAESMDKYAYKRDEVFRLFDSREPFYISESRCPYKKWLVKVDGMFEPDQARIFGFFELSFTSASPYAVSIGTTLNVAEESQYFGVGGISVIDEGDPVIQYEFTSALFSLFNDGELLNPERPFVEQKITLKGNLINPTIKNLTTGDVWSWTGTATTNDSIVLEGIRSYKNEETNSIFRGTNKKLIRIAPGWNEFQVTGATDFTISFDLRFLYV
jgi:hypothetical protein